MPVPVFPALNWPLSRRGCPDFSRVPSCKWKDPLLQACACSVNCTPQCQSMCFEIPELLETRLSGHLMGSCTKSLHLTGCRAAGLRPSLPLPPTTFLTLEASPITCYALDSIAVTFCGSPTDLCQNEGYLTLFWAPWLDPRYALKRCQCVSEWVTEWLSEWAREWGVMLYRPLTSTTFFISVLFSLWGSLSKT